MLHQQTKELMSFLPNMRDGFIVFEGKASNGYTTHAFEQARCVGTCLVFTQRYFLSSICHQNALGADERTYVYSVTMDSNWMCFWVHFAVVDMLEDGNTDVNFYMKRIYSKTHGEDDSLPHLRRVCPNILDWGVWARKRMSEKRYKSIVEYDGRYEGFGAVE